MRPRAGTATVVAFGARLGGGCTSGHGICGVARLSVRSIVATAIFMVAGVPACARLLQTEIFPQNASRRRAVSTRQTGLQQFGLH